MTRPSRFFFCAVCTILAPLALVSCQTYQPKALSAKVVDRTLATQDLGVLEVRASAIQHPLLPPLEFDPRQGLTPEQVGLVAVIANPTLRAQRDLKASATAAVLQAGLLPNPQITANYDWVTGGNTLGAVNAYGWGLSYDVSALLAHPALVRAAKENAAAVDLGIAWQEWQTAEAAKQAAYDLISLRAQLGVAREIDNRLQQNWETLKQAAAAHLKTTVDLSAAEAAARDSHATVLQAERDVEHQRLALNRAMGLSAETQVQLRSQLALPSRFTLPDEKELIDGTDQRRLDLVGLRRGYASEEQTLRAAVLNQLPHINLGFERSNDNTGVHMAGPAITVDLPVFDRNQGAIAVERATRQRLFDEYISRVFEARSDIAIALSDLRALNRQIADHEAALPNLRRLVDVYRQATDRGNADVISYYVAWNNLAQKNLDMLKLQQQLADTQVALELASGRYFPVALPTTTPATQPMPAPSAVSFANPAQEMP